MIEHSYIIKYTVLIHSSVRFVKSLLTYSVSVSSIFCYNKKATENSNQSNNEFPMFKMKGNKMFIDKCTQSKDVGERWVLMRPCKSSNN